MSELHLHWFLSLVSATGAARLRATPLWGEDSSTFPLCLFVTQSRIRRDGPQKSPPKKQKKGVGPCSLSKELDQRWRVSRSNYVCSPFRHKFLKSAKRALRKPSFRSIYRHGLIALFA